MGLENRCTLAGSVLASGFTVFALLSFPGVLAFAVVAGLLWFSKSTGF